MKTRIFFWSIASALAGFLFGFDTVVISGAEQKIPALWGLSAGLRAGDGVRALRHRGRLAPRRLARRQIWPPAHAAVHRIVRLYFFAGTRGVGFFTQPAASCRRAFLNSSRRTRSGRAR